MSYRMAVGDVDDLLEEAQGEPVGGFEVMAGHSSAIQDAIRVGKRVARGAGSSASIVGEPGTGREGFARAIHRASSRWHEPFLAIDCAAMPVRHLESEIFGMDRPGLGGPLNKPGLVEVAGAGTLFLDHVARLPLEVQPKLLRAIEERRVRRASGLAEVDVRCRIFVASTTPLEVMLDRGELREDLFYRLNAVNLTLPPLRERGDDVVALAERTLDKVGRARGFPGASLTPAARAALIAHDWPGNGRELKTVIERAAMATDGGLIDADDLALGGREPQASPGETAEGISIPPAGRSLRSVEAELMQRTLEITGGNKAAAARILGVSRQTMHRKVSEYDLESAGTE